MTNFSSKSISELSQLLKPNKYKKIFILSGKNSFFLSGAKKILDKSANNKEFYFYLKKSKIPEINELKDIIFKLKIKKGECNIKKYRSLFAIPTTAGSGAEVTSNAVIYIKKIKYSVEDKSLLPEKFLLIPELIIGLKKNLKSSAGFDAIAQSIESMLSKKSSSKSVKYATRSLKFSLANYINHVKNPSLENTYNMSLAANFSGKAISISKTTAPHALSYPFTSHFGINHGHAVSLTFNDFLKFNFKNIKHADCNFDLNQRYEILFKLTKTSNINEFDLFIKNLKRKANLESNLKKLKIDINKSMPLILKGVNLQRLSNNPIKLKISDLKFILKNKIN